MNLLPSYLAHIKDFPDTLLTRYYGLYSAEIGGRKSRFVIMNNLFENGMPHEAYDLKGSSGWFEHNKTSSSSKVSYTQTYFRPVLRYRFCPHQSTVQS